MDQKLQFIAAYQAGTFSVSELCARYGISRKTGYKWIARYKDEGVDGLKDRSRAPHHSPHKMSDAAAEAILHARRLHPTWGPRKLIAVQALRRAVSGVCGPAKRSRNRACGVPERSTTETATW